MVRSITDWESETLQRCCICSISTAETNSLHTLYKKMHRVTSLTFPISHQLGLPEVSLFAKCQYNEEENYLENFYDFLQSQKFTYTSLAFGIVAFKLLDLCQMFCVSFQRFLTTVFWNFGPFVLTDLVGLGQVWRLCYSHTLYQLCSQIFYRTEIRALWWLPQNTDFIVFEPHCNSFGGNFWVIVHL